MVSERPTCVLRSAWSDAADFRVGDDDAGLHDVAGGDLELDAGRDDLQVHLRLGQFDRFEAGTLQPLQDRQDVLRKIEVVQPAIAVRQHSPHLPVQRADHPAVAVRLQPGVDVAVEQLGLLGTHALEVGERDLELVGELPTRQTRDAVFAVSLAGVDDQLEAAILIGTALQEGRRHDQVALGGDLALEFVGQVDEGTSALHGESPEKLQERPPAMRGCTSPLG